MIIESCCRLHRGKDATQIRERGTCNENQIRLLQRAPKVGGMKQQQEEETGPNGHKVTAGCCATFSFSRSFATAAVFLFLYVRFLHGTLAVPAARSLGAHVTVCLHAFAHETLIFSSCFLLADGLCPLLD